MHCACPHFFREIDYPSYKLFLLLMLLGFTTNLSFYIFIKIVFLSPRTAVFGVIWLHLSTFLNKEDKRADSKDGSLRNWGQTIVSSKGTVPVNLTEYWRKAVTSFEVGGAATCADF